MVRMLMVVAGAAFAASAAGQPVILTDDFADPARTAALWGNERGDWQVVAGSYGAQAPNNNPLTFSAAPFDLTDLDLEFDILATDDGGIWLHADAAGQNGVLLVFALGRVYWHHVIAGNAGGIINLASGVYTIGQALHVRVTIVGNVYTCFVNGAFVTSYTTAAFPSGRVGLYDFRNPNHNYDNVVLKGLCGTGDCCPVPYAPAADVVVCPGTSGVLTAAPAGSPPLAYAWQIEDASTPGVWHAVPEGEDASRGLTFTGAASPTLDVLSRTGAGPALVSHANFRCLITNGCGSDATGTVRYTILECCPDVNCDFALDGFDVEAQEKATGGDVTDYCLPDPDFNGDFALDGFDVEAVEIVVGGGPCP